MKKILLIAVMAFMTALSMSADTTVDELANDIERLQKKIKNVSLRHIDSRTKDANVAAWKNQIERDFTEIVELSKKEDKEVESVTFTDFDLDGNEYEVPFIYIVYKDPFWWWYAATIHYKDGTTEYMLYHR